jgi:molecular chaperone GrpE
LTPAEIDAILAQFRGWLERLTEDPPIAATVAEPAIDLATMVGAFTALRHDVGLQTKAARTQAEQAAQALALLHDAIDRLGGSTSPEDSSGSPILVSLIEAADVLYRAERGLERALIAASAPGRRRWFGGRDTGSAAMRTNLAGTLEGVKLGRQRIERLIQRHGLEAIPAVGFPFDAETMEAIEVSSNSGQPVGTVIEEVRIGYHREGAVFRCAQVKVAR